MSEAKIAEVFLSYQGEGPYTGKKQVFVRFFGCSFGCAYCDTKPKNFEIITARDLYGKVMEFKEEYHSVSITGGEPLEQADFLLEFLPMLKTLGKKVVYLETNGIFHQNLQKVINSVDIVSMDIKVPSSTGKPALWEDHRKFLEIAKAKEVFVKIVVTDRTRMEDISKARDIVHAVNPSIKIILQPVDPVQGMREPSKEYLYKMRKMISNAGGNARIMPQQHKARGYK